MSVQVDLAMPAGLDRGVPSTARARLRAAALGVVAALLVPLPAAAAAAPCEQALRYAAQSGAGLLRINTLDVGPTGRTDAPIRDVGVGYIKSTLVAKSPVKAAALGRMLDGGPANHEALAEVLQQTAPPTHRTPEQREREATEVGPVSLGANRLSVHARWDPGMACGNAAGEATRAQAELRRAGVVADGDAALVRVPGKIVSRSTTAMERPGPAARTVAAASFAGGGIELLDGAVEIKVVRPPSLLATMSGADGGEVRYKPAVIEVSGAGFETARLDTAGDNVELRLDEDGEPAPDRDAAGDGAGRTGTDRPGARENPAGQATGNGPGTRGDTGSGTGTAGDAGTRSGTGTRSSTGTAGDTGTRSSTGTAGDTGTRSSTGRSTGTAGDTGTRSGTGGGTRTAGDKGMRGGTGGGNQDQVRGVDDSDGNSGTGQVGAVDDGNAQAGASKDPVGGAFGATGAPTGAGSRDQHGHADKARKVTRGNVRDWADDGSGTRPFGKRPRAGVRRWPAPIPVPDIPGVPLLPERDTEVAPAGGPGTTVRVSLGEVRQAVSGHIIAARATAISVAIIGPDTRTYGDSAPTRSGVALDLDMGLLEVAAVAPEAAGGTTNAVSGAAGGLPITGPRVDVLALTGLALLIAGAAALIVGLRGRPRP